MKVLLISDTHHNTDTLRCALSDNPEIKTVIHAGDGALDTNEFSNSGICFYRVRGNCDGDIPLDDTLVFSIGGVKILLTHGHLFRVSYQTDALLEKAKSEGCAAAVFGHTHKAVVENKNNILLINPGTANRSRAKDKTASYAVMEIENSEITKVEIIKA